MTGDLAADWRRLPRASIYDHHEMGSALYDVTGLAIRLTVQGVTSRRAVIGTPPCTAGSEYRDILNEILLESTQIHGG